MYFDDPGVDGAYCSKGKASWGSKRETRKKWRRNVQGLGQKIGVPLQLRVFASVFGKASLILDDVE